MREATFRSPLVACPGMALHSLPRGKRLAREFTMKAYLTLTGAAVLFSSSIASAAMLLDPADENRAGVWINVPNGPAAAVQQSQISTYSLGQGAMQRTFFLKAEENGRRVFEDQSARPRAY